MNNTKEQPTTLEKISTFYLLSLSAYVIYFITTPWTELKAYILLIKILIAYTLLTAETLIRNK